MYAHLRRVAIAIRFNRRSIRFHPRDEIGKQALADPPDAIGAEE
jgi:hypothetical protein